MWEVVKTVKGYDITRMIGSRGAYHVSVREGKGFREFHTFKTILRSKINHFFKGKFRYDRAQKS